MRSVYRLAAVLLCLAASAVYASAEARAGEPPLVLAAEGRPRAEIVVAPDRPRMVTLAALELRHVLAEMSGVRLPIVTAPTAEPRVRIHVGRSDETDRLGVTTEGLAHGAYRIRSGPDWIVLIGRDIDFDPSKLPWPLKRNDVPRAAAEWAKATAGKTDAAWAFPFASGFKGYWNPKDFTAALTRRYGDDFSALWKRPNGPSPEGFWNEDESGSFNAVCGLLRHLGVRSFMPGEVGQVIPKAQTIAAGAFDETVRPDYALRNWIWYNFASFDFDTVIWTRRLGMNAEYEVLGPNSGPHGLTAVHSHEAMHRAHPDYYALINNVRDTQHRERGTPCFTSDGFTQETARYVRFLYDAYDVPSVDLWPVDGLRVCECEGCKGKSASELVWGFADRVARDLYNTHPQKRITCGAYTSYANAPDTIDKFSPNLAVWIANAARPLMEDAEHWAEYQARVAQWREKIAPGNILRLENNRYHIWGVDAPIAYPVLHPRGVARDLKAMKGISVGDTGEQSQVDGKWRAPALEHVTLYVQSRFLWDADQDVDAVLDEYCRLFYGPAAARMNEAITFAEHNLAYKDQSRSRGRGNPANVSLGVALRLRAMLEEAKTAAGEGTVYADRIGLMLSELQPKDELMARHREKGEALAAARGNNPVATAAGADLAAAEAYALKDDRTGAAVAADVATTFRIGWDRDALLLDVLCKEPDIANLKAATDVRSGDRILLTLETPLHGPYHLEINPDGTLVEGNPGPAWKSLAEVRAERGPDSWRVRLRLPVVGDAEFQSDPKHRVAGPRPTREFPWHFNLTRIRSAGLPTPQLQSFSPTRGSPHAAEKFGTLQGE